MSRAIEANDYAGPSANSSSSTLSRTNMLKRLIKANQPELLSPIWESFITGMEQPTHRRTVERYQQGQQQHNGEEHISIWRRGIHFHPFNFSDPEVSLSRAQYFLSMLNVFIPWRRPRSWKAWWPQDAASLVNVLKLEQELKERGATRGEQITAVARAGELEAQGTPALPKNKKLNGILPDSGAAGEEEKHKRRRLE